MEIAAAPARPPLAVDIRRAAEMLGVSAWTVRAYIHTGALPVVKLPAVRSSRPSRRVLIAVADLEAFLNEHRRVGAGR
jgi:predicted site-specific integrase-resolvase